MLFELISDVFRALLNPTARVCPGCRSASKQMFRSASQGLFHSGDCASPIATNRAAPEPPAMHLQEDIRVHFDHSISFGFKLLVQTSMEVVDREIGVYVGR